MMKENYSDNQKVVKKNIKYLKNIKMQPRIYVEVVGGMTPIVDCVVNFIIPQLQ